MKMEKLKVADIEWLKLQPGHSHIAEKVSLEQAHALEKAAHSYTIRTDSGEIALVGGLAEYWPGRSEAWVLFNRNCRAHIVGIHRIVKRFLDIVPVRRIEAAVNPVADCFGQRWVQKLGFELEAPLLRGYLPGGNDCALYARVS